MNSCITCHVSPRAPGLRRCKRCANLRKKCIHCGQPCFRTRCLACWSSQRFGPNSPRWNGNDASKNAKRGRAQRLYAVGGPCEFRGCTSASADRHHIDGNPGNNASENIELLCRRHHMERDGRLAALVARNMPGELNASGSRKLTEADVKSIIASTKSHAQLGREYGVTGATIRSIRVRGRWRHIKARVAWKSTRKSRAAGGAA